MNTQPIEKQHLTEDGALDVHSVFYTIQGEGPFVGQPAVFVRLAGCNLQCPLCDTDYTSVRIFTSPGRLLEVVEHNLDIGCDLVVITGGEPFRQNITPFVQLLLDCGFRVQIETNGTLSLAYFPYDKVTIVCSPKAGKVNPTIGQHAAAFKYVLHRAKIAPDGLPILALNHPAHPQVARPPEGFKGPIYLQPVDEGDRRETENRANLEATVESCMKHGYTLGIQVHKLIGKE